MSSKRRNFRLTFAAAAVLLVQALLCLPSDMPVPGAHDYQQSLDRALLDAGVRFLYCCHPTGLVTDADGSSAGVSIQQP